MDTPVHDYLAVIHEGLIGTWGRDPDRAKAIRTAIRIYKRDVGSVFKLKRGHEVVVNVVDVAPHNEVWWDDRGFWIGEDKLDRKIERVHHVL